MREIADYTFRYCESITEVKIPDTVEVIGNYAFENCSGLTKVEVPGSVYKIGRDVFKKCQEVVIVTPNNSYAANYASENNLVVRN